MPKAREEDEMSAAYTGRKLSISTTDGMTCSAGDFTSNDGAVGGASALMEGVATHNGRVQINLAQGQGQGQGQRPPSVRYTKEPANHTPQIRRHPTRVGSSKWCIIE